MRGMLGENRRCSGLGMRKPAGAARDRPRGGEPHATGGEVEGERDPLGGGPRRGEEVAEGAVRRGKPRARAPGGGTRVGGGGDRGGGGPPRGGPPPPPPPRQPPPGASET